MSNRVFIYFNISENSSHALHRSLRFRCYRNTWGFQSTLKGEPFHPEVCPLPLWGRLAGTTVLHGPQSRAAGWRLRLSLHIFPAASQSHSVLPADTLVSFCPCKVRPCRTGPIPAPLQPFPRVFPEEETHSPSPFSCTCLQ